MIANVAGTTIINRFAAEGVIGDMDCVYSSWATGEPGGFTDGQVTALQQILPFLALAIKSVSLAHMTGTLMQTYLGRDAGQRGPHRDGLLQSYRSRDHHDDARARAGLCRDQAAGLSRGPGTRTNAASRLATKKPRIGDPGLDRAPSQRDQNRTLRPPRKTLAS